MIRSRFVGTGLCRIRRWRLYGSCSVVGVGREDWSVGELWDKITGAEATERSQAILEEKYPATRGLSEEWM
jgi:hypothetical protein